MLFLVPTPIGNLEDISKRSLDVLAGADKIFCEDTRITKKLLTLLSQKYDIEFPCKDFISFHSHNEQNILNSIDKNEFASKNIVYVSDAGMPCISDPGASLVQFAYDNAIEVDVLPGANAVLGAYALSGFNMTEFTFFGFLDHKGTNRAKKLNQAMSNEFVSILYESPHRLLKLLEEIVKIDEAKELFLVKELTKMHQRSYKGASKELLDALKSENIKGEWVVVIKPVASKEGSPIELNDILALDLRPKSKAKLISKLTGRNTKEVYQEILDRIAQ